MGKLEEKKKEKKENIFVTAFELFTSKGFQKTSISDIVNKAGVAKGTFYLYFKDKYDIRNKLISYKSNILFTNAYNALQKTDITKFNDKIIFMVDNIIEQFKNDTSLLKFISKNLGWGVFKNVLIHPSEHTNLEFYTIYLNMINDCQLKFKNPEVMLFIIVELVSSTCYNSILYNEPLNIEEFKPYLYDSICSIIQNQKIE